MIKWAGWMLILYGVAHTVGALTLEGAGIHAGAWFSGQLWNGDFGAMSPAMSAWWFSIDSFGPPLTLIGVMVLWLDYHGIIPPLFLPLAVGTWTLIDAAVLLYTPWPITLIASILLLVDTIKARGRLANVKR